MKKAIKNKKGIASFYVVAFSTLILLVIVVSFASLVVSQMTRSSNADLSQSAYDAAMAGVEDAKMAYMNYLNCKRGSGIGDCGDVVKAIENDSPACNMVSRMLGQGNSNVVAVTEKNTSNNMQQYYTCVKIYNNPTEQQNTVSAYQPTVFKPVFTSDEEIKLIKIQWGKEGDTISSLPKLSVSVIQAPESFKADSFTFPHQVGEEPSTKQRTNMGTVFLEPCKEGCDGKTVTYDKVVESNNKVASKSPYKVKCDSGVCVATIRLTEKGSYGDGEWNSEAFEVIVTGYEGEDKQVTISYCTGAEAEGGTCSEENAVPINNQFIVDSTGRANDLFKRVRVVLDVEGVDGATVAGPLMLGKDGLVKDFSVSTEYSKWEQ